MKILSVILNTIFLQFMYVFYMCFLYIVGLFVIYR